MAEKKIDLIGIPSPVMVIGSYDAAGTADFMTAVYGGVCGGEPPCIAVAVRKSRKTYQNIKENNVFSVNLPDASFVEETDFFGMISGYDFDKSLATDLRITKSAVLDVPVLSDFPVSYACRKIKQIDMNTHWLIIGEIQERILPDAGKKTLRELDVLVYDLAENLYFGIGKRIGAGFQAGEKLLRKAKQIKAQEV